MPRLLLALLLSAPLFAQTPIPTVLSRAVDVAAPSPVTGGGAGAVSIAAGSTNFLTASVTLTHPAFLNTEVLVMLVDAQGRPLLPFSWRLGNTLGDEAGVASSGRSYLVAWGSLGATSGALFDDRGQPLGDVFEVHAPTRRQLSSRDDGGSRTVAWDGSQYVVASTAEFLRPTPAVESFPIATLVSEEGTILRNDIRLFGFTTPAVAARDGVTLFATPYEPVRGISVQRMTSDGTVSEPTVVGTTAATHVSVAASPENFLVTWFAGGAVRGQYIGRNGLQSGLPFVIGTTGQAFDVDVTWNGSAYVVSWVDFDQNLQALRVAGTTPLDPAPRLIATRATNHDSASNGTATLLPWSSTSTVRAQPLGQEAPAPEVHRILPERTNPLIASHNGAVTAVWREGTNILLRDLSTNTPARVVGTDMPNFLPMAFAKGPAGTLIVAGTRAIVNETSVVELGGTPGARMQAIATSDGFAVAWSSPGEGIVVVRLRANGTIAERRVLAGRFAEEVALAASRDRLLVAWYGSFDGGLFASIDGGEPFLIGNPAVQARVMSIASDGERFLVTWINKQGVNPNDFVQGQLIAPDGSFLGPRLPIYTGGDDFKRSLRLFWTGENYLAVYSDSAGDTSAVRIDAGGGLLDYPARVLGQFGFHDAALVEPARLAFVGTLVEPYPKPWHSRVVVRSAETPSRRRAVR
ncbi:MAG TPA: hypothetical protein VGF69_15200 [Thermoanaerobaculia bacterium]